MIFQLYLKDVAWVFAAVIQTSLSLQDKLLHISPVGMEQMKWQLNSNMPMIQCKVLNIKASMAKVLFAAVFNISSSIIIHGQHTKFQYLQNNFMFLMEMIGEY